MVTLAERMKLYESFSDYKLIPRVPIVGRVCKGAPMFERDREWLSEILKVGNDEEK